MRIAILSWLLLLGSWVSAHADWQTVQPTGDTVSLTPVSYYLPNAQRQGIAQVMASAEQAWQQNQHPYADYTAIAKEQRVWLRIRFDSSQVKQQNWYIHHQFFHLDYLEYYVVNDGKLVDQYTVGERFPYASRPVDYQDFILPLTLSQGINTEIYLLAQDPRMLRLPLQMMTQHYYLTGLSKNVMLFLLISGAIVAIALYNLLLFLSIRDPSYLAYFVLTSLVLLVQLCFVNLDFRFLWPGLPNVHYWARMLLPNLMHISAAFFCYFVLDLRSKHRLYMQLLGLTILVNVLVMACALLSVLDFRELSSMVAALFNYVVVSFISYRVWRQGVAYSVYLMLAELLALATTVFYFIAFTVGFYDADVMLIVVFAGALRALLASFALAARIRDSQEKQLLAEADNETKSRFLVQMSHRIRTPMSGVLGMSELLRGYLTDPVDRHYNKVVQGSGMALLNIVNDIIDYTKIEDGALEIIVSDFDLRNLLIETLPLFRNTALDKNLDFYAEVNPRVPALLKGDANRIRQILLNLTSNALKFTNTGEVVVSVDYQSSQLSLTVVDTGIGIKDEVQTTLFQEFQQADESVAHSYGGTGLGLAICRQLVNLMGGDIGVQSEVDKGSCFWLHLPLASTQKSAQELLVFSTSPNIVVVEDNARRGQEWARQWQQWGCQVQVFETLAQVPQQSKNPELLVLPLQISDYDQAQYVAKIADLGLTAVKCLWLSDFIIGGQNVNAAYSIEKPLLASEFHAHFCHLLLGAELQVKLTEQASGDKKPPKKHILVAEDNLANQQVLRYMLDDLSQDIDLVETGCAALAKFTEPNNRYDLVLMDCEMPQMNGFESTEKIRAWEQQQSLDAVPIYAVTAHVMSQQKQACLASGMTGYLAKPIDYQALRELIAGLK